jgi:hypothetical protein
MVKFAHNPKEVSSKKLDANASHKVQEESLLMKLAHKSEQSTTLLNV